MIDTDAVIETISKQFAGVQDLGDGILRGERYYDGKVFSTVYFDVSDHVVERADNLSGFQEKLLGSDFFRADSDQRWNSYLYFLVGPNSASDKNLLKAKALIEADRHFARKFVLSEDAFLDRLSNIADQTREAHVSDDASVRWGELLRAASLGVVLEQRPRTQTLELIASGEAFVTENSSVINKTILSNDDPLSIGLLRNLRVDKFRSAINDRDFSFGDVNLIFGQNGAGKTSLLESVEALYCGRVRRDSSARPSEITGELVMPDGSLVKIKSDPSPSAVKARNLAWYGRSNQQSSAITNSFTRFNFLDTDAAFRLASVSNAVDIKDDIGLLLVGPEASTLWVYLAKLNDEVATKCVGANQQVDLLLKQSDLLSSEVDRLKESPSTSTTLAKTYRADLRALGAKWDLGADTAADIFADRDRLEFLSRGFKQAISISQSTPTTVRILKERTVLIEQALTMLHDRATEYDNVSKDLVATEDMIKKYQSNLQSLQSWAPYCEANAPEIYESKAEKVLIAAALSLALGGVSADEIQEIPEKYESKTIQEALEAANINLQYFEEQERLGIMNLKRIEQMEQSVAALRSDLGAVASSIINRTRDASHCPICMTTHDEDELLRKIEELSSSKELFATKNLREELQTTKESMQWERVAIQSLKALKRFAAASVSLTTESVSVSQLCHQLIAKHGELETLNNELSDLESFVESLSLSGVDLRQYEAIRNTATAVLGEGNDVTSQDVVNKKLKFLRLEIAAENNVISELDIRLGVITKNAVHIALSAGIPSIASTLRATPAELFTIVERTSGMIHASIVFLQEATRFIELDDDQSFENLHESIEQTITCLDRAQHAAQKEAMAGTELGKKTMDLQCAKEQLRQALSRLDNLEKARGVMAHIVRDHSIEKATQEALESIRISVSDIFSRIHAPAEYMLGDFQGDSLLVTREGGLSHGVHQVSTGQRAALALSIFLALNRSAESAPPVILIDDPVAHIDDLNALSFLDYLRDLAIGTQKQIFFATADAKLAALFQKKFEFLGDRYKKIVLR